MNEVKTVELEALLGEHLLDAVDTFVERVKNYGDQFEDANAIRFRLDGIVYTAVEDPSDGYRSSLGSIFVSPNDEIRNVFPPTRVVVTKNGNADGQTNDTLQFIDVETSKIVMEVGTDNTDDYYPYFVGEFNPQNLAANAVRI